MSDWEDEQPQEEVQQILAENTIEGPEIKLFSKWSLSDIEVSDISLQDYISVKDKAAKYLPHSAGRYQIKRFRKATCPIAERLASSLMAHGRNNGKKLMTVRIVKHAFEIIHLLTGEVSYYRVENVIFPRRIQFKSWSMPSSTAVLVKIRPVLVALALFVVKLLTFLRYVVSIRLSG
jgi:hypothetical protein